MTRKIAVLKTCVRLLCLMSALDLLTSFVQAQLPYVAAPADNPLKGLVPYADPHPDRFPHSMEFSYVALSELMTGPDEFNWEPLEELLNDVASRRCQTVFRVWMEYPGHDEGIPKFLEDSGVRVTEWLNTNTDPLPQQKVRTPDYSDPRLRAALARFITALGSRYDGDPRIGYITAGLLGTWGEWHTYPREELMAGKDVQTEIMDAYEQAFEKTPVLLRYPAGHDAWAHAPNHKRRFGYHDDSFAWATLDTSRKQDDWFFIPSLKAAGSEAVNKWKTSPIGGEIRPELWGQIFDDKPRHKQAQDFGKCVRQTHVTWLMDTGMFDEKQSAVRIENATRQIQQMGYEFHIMKAGVESNQDGNGTVTIMIRNAGVAPFYHDWKVELAAIVDGSASGLVPVDWSVRGLLPDDEPRVWMTKVPASMLAGGEVRFAIRIANPLKNGRPVRFANQYSDDSPDDWWTIPGIQR